MEDQATIDLQKLKEERQALEKIVLQLCSNCQHPSLMGLTIIENYHLIEAINELVRKEKVLTAGIDREERKQ